MKKTILLIPFLAFVLMASGQVTSKVVNAMEQLRQSGGKNINYDTAPFKEEIDNNAIALLNSVAPYLQDTVKEVRAYAIELIVAADVAESSTQLKASSGAACNPVSERAVSLLVTACADKEAGNVGRASEYLQGSSRDCFSPQAKALLVTYLQTEMPYLENIFMLAGYLKLTEATPYLKSALTNTKLNGKTKWAAHLALARMGDSSETDYCLRVVKAKEMSDGVVYTLLPGLIYTRQKEAFNYLVTILNSDDKSCSSTDPDNEAEIVCGYRVMEYLAPYVKDFPLKVSGASGQIEADDYDVALQQAREWFKANEDFVIIDEVF